MNQDNVIPMNGRRLENWRTIREYALAGNARFTLRSGRTQRRFTYRVVRARKREGLWFVSFLRGPDNGADYAYLGTLDAGGALRLTRASQAGPTAPAYQAFLWFALAMAQGRTSALAQFQFFHLGRCGRCGRELTVPESVERGLGPECAGAA